MKSPYELEIDHLALGLTKPPMKFGVPLVGFYMSILGCLLGWMVFQALTASTGFITIFAFLLLWLAIYGGMAGMSFRDPFGLAIAWINFLNFRTSTARRFWGNTESYRP